MAELLWQPTQEQIKSTNMYRFMQQVNERFGQSFTGYPELYQWSIDNIPDFWALMWEFADIQASTPYTRVVDDVTKMPGAHWFEGARLNFAENLLRYRDDQVALIFKGEASEATTMTYAQLYDEVARVAKTLRDMGIRPGDRVVGFMPNMPQTTVAMLAAVSAGATWSSCSPDFGIKGVLDRFGQIKPRVLFTANGYSFKGRKIDSLGRIADILKQLPSIEKVVVVPYTEAQPDISAVPHAVHYADFKSSEDGLEIDFEQIAYKELQVSGGIGQRRPSWKRALTLMQRGLIPNEKLISHQFPLEEWDRAMSVQAQLPEHFLRHHQQLLMEAGQEPRHGLRIQGRYLHHPDARSRRIRLLRHISPPPPS